MNQYFALLGNHPKIATEELRAIGAEKITNPTEKIAFFSHTQTANQLMNRLGSTIKIGLVIKKWQNSPNQTQIQKQILEHLTNLNDEKINFSINTYQTPKHLRPLAIGLEIKKSLKAEGKSVRLVTAKTNETSAVIIKKNKILQTGGDFNIIQSNGATFLTKTTAIQDFEAWSHRDYDRPGTDAKRGMLPPKLARTLINLSGANPKSSSILDPFCGSGTVLMEAALLGYDKIIGGDISEKAIKDTEMNANWLIQENITTNKPTLATSPAETLIQKLPTLKGKVDTTVTEPFLGNPRSGKESIQELKSQTNTLENLYIKSLIGLKPFLAPGARLIITIPTFYTGKHTPNINLNTQKILKSAGYTHLPFHTPLTYARKGQHVGRTIIRTKIAQA